MEEETRRQTIALATMGHRFGVPNDDGLSSCFCGEVTATCSREEAEHHASLVLDSLRSLPVEERAQALGFVKIERDFWGPLADTIGDEILYPLPAGREKK